MFLNEQKLNLLESTLTGRSKMVQSYVWELVPTEAAILVLGVASYSPVGLTQLPPTVVSVQCSRKRALELEQLLTTPLYVARLHMSYWPKSVTKPSPERMRRKAQGMDTEVQNALESLYRSKPPGGME